MRLPLRQARPIKAFAGEEI